VNGATALLVVPPKVLHGGLTVTVLWTARAKGSSDAPQSGKLTFSIGALPMLVGSTPAAAASIGSPPDSITLVFDQPLASNGTTIAVTIDGHRVTASAPSLGADGKTVSVTLTGATPGHYEVTWSVKNRVSMPTHGMVSFTAS
jgi:methionine-rich copper-binding protein CopC